MRTLIATLLFALTAAANSIGSVPQGTGIRGLGGPSSSDYGPDGRGYGGFPKPDEWPTVLFRTEPKYTDEARKDRVQGTVTVRLVIDAQGKPQNIRVEKGLGHGLDENAVAAVSAWLFSPGRANRITIAVPISVEVRFRLPD